MFFIVVYWLLPSYVAAKYSVGVISTDQNWVYLDRFCFVSNDGVLQYFFQYPVSHEIESIYLYFDTEDQWKAAYNSQKTCKEKEDLLDPSNNQIVHLTSDAPKYEDSSCKKVNITGEEWYQCMGNRSFYSQRPRWWYLALGNCDSTSGLYLEYSILMTNANITNRWFYHFSFDEFYALPLTIVFMVLELIILVISITFTYILKSRNMLHPTFKMFLHALIFDISCVIALWLHYDRYADDGRGFPLLKFVGIMFRQISVVTFITLLLLLAKGYTITRRKISFLSVMKLLLFVAAFFLGHVTMMLWEILIFDPAKVTYMSESLPAYILAVLRILAWLWYIRSSYVTVRKYPLKRLFYMSLSVLMSFYFWSAPITLIIANFVLDNWVREEVMLAVESAVMVYGFCTFLVLTNPMPNNKNFPYHVRTNQISQDNYPQSVYEVQYSSGGMASAD
uniref:GpcrRhopsn4 domain-containing protein n=1 Tax=Bursaphelenchus xylophilus TaxID=6326 RepID=A0A1I7SSU0_BURXY